MFYRRSVKVSEEEMIATVLEKAPREYSTVLTCEQRVKGATLTMIDLAEAMNQLWRTMNTGTEETDKEVSLMSNKNITCYKCDKKGHKAFQCKSEGNGDSKSKEEAKREKFKGKCSTCGQNGHKAENCFKDPKNAGKVPDWYKELIVKREAEKEETFMSINDTEVSLMIQDKRISNSMSVLRDPNIWIAD